MIADSGGVPFGGEILSPTSKIEMTNPRHPNPRTPSATTLLGIRRHASDIITIHQGTLYVPPALVPMHVMPAQREAARTAHRRKIQENQRFWAFVLHHAFLILLTTTRIAMPTRFFSVIRWPAILRNNSTELFPLSPWFSHESKTTHGWMIRSMPTNTGGVDGESPKRERESETAHAFEDHCCATALAICLGCPLTAAGAQNKAKRCAAVRRWMTLRILLFSSGSV